MYYYGARWYDPYISRFTQPDTIVPKPENPQSLNRFSYVRNNPLVFTDPTGHWVQEDAGPIQPIRLLPPVRNPRYTTSFGPGHATGIDVKNASDPTNSSWKMNDMKAYSDESQDVFAAADGVVIGKGKGATDAYGWDITDEQGNKQSTIYNWDRNSWHGNDQDATGNPLYTTPEEYKATMQAQHPGWQFESWETGRSDYVTIQHPGGFTTRYFHAASSLTVGTEVKAGDTIGRYNATGPTTGSHVHFEMRICGVAYDPSNYIR